MISSEERAKRFREARSYRTDREVYEETKKNGNPVSQSMISDLESASRNRPVQYQKIVTLAECYGVNVAWLMGQSKSPSFNEDKQAAEKVTGLSAEAIDVLAKIKETKLIETVNKIIEHII